MPTVPTPHDHAYSVETLAEKKARLTAQQADAEQPPTATEQAYNVAKYGLFQLAAHGHHQHAPLFDRKTGRYLTIREIEAGSRAYNELLRTAQDQFEAAALLLAAERLEADGGPVCNPGDCCWFDAVTTLRRTATALTADQTTT